jgi:glycosyltransferase involved in cell wall biosynthesis
MKLKVLHVITSLTPGGAEILLINSLSEGGLQNYTDNSVAYFNKTSLLADRIDKSVEIYCLNYKGLFSLAHALLRLRKIIIKNEIDIVHTHLTSSGFLTHLILPGKVKQVHTIHTTYSMNFETNSKLLWLEKHLYFTSKNCNIICLSDYTKDDFLKTVPFKGRVFVLNNFVDDVFFNLQHEPYSAHNKSLKLIAVGTLKPLKNFEFLLDVFGHLKDYNITLDIYGGGEKKSYENVIKNKNLKINMMGFASNMETIISNYDLFIMPSKFEGFPLSLFEAMACGVPLMLADIAPLKSIVKENAIYFDYDDKATADIIISVFNKKTDTTSLAKKAKIYAENTVRRDTYTKRLFGIYKELRTIKKK